MVTTPHKSFAHRALDKVKSPWAGIAAVIPIVFGLWLDYKQETRYLGDKQDTIVDQSEDAEDARIEQDVELQGNLKLVLEGSIRIENRLATLEAKVSGLENDRKSLIQYILGGGGPKPEEPRHKLSKPNVHGLEVETDVKKGGDMPKELKFTDPKAQGVF